MTRIVRNPLHAAATLLLAGIVAASAAIAQENGARSRAEVSLMGGIQALNENNTGLPDQILDIPAVATLGYRFTPNWALEGEFTWLIPVKQQVDLGSSPAQDLKTPDILAYQANVRADWPFQSWSPYLAAGLGGITFLSNTDADRVPKLNDSQTLFAINFGAGATYALASRWGLRVDVREFGAFPSKDASGLSSGGDADPIWMERGTLGLAYRF